MRGLVSPNDTTTTTTTPFFSPFLLLSTGPSFPLLPLRRAQHTPPSVSIPFPLRTANLFPLSTAENSSPTFKFHRDSPSIRRCSRLPTILLNLRLETLFHPSRHVRLSFFVRRFDDSLSKSLSLSLSPLPGTSRRWVSSRRFPPILGKLPRSFIRASERDYQLEIRLKRATSYSLVKETWTS